jgi:hypothetical protein
MRGDCRPNASTVRLYKDTLQAQCKTKCTWKMQRLHSCAATALGLQTNSWLTQLADEMLKRDVKIQLQSGDRTERCCQHIVHIATLVESIAANRADTSRAPSKMLPRAPLGVDDAVVGPASRDTTL